MNRFAALTAFLTLAAPGCAVALKADPLWPDHYSPMGTLEIPEHSVRHAEVTLRFKRVTAVDHLRQEMVFRRSLVEFGIYQDYRWTEPPAEYVRRALAFALFERRGITRTHATSASTLEVEVTEFVETRSPPGVEIEVVVQLSKNDVVLLQETFRVREPLAGSKDEDDSSKVEVAVAAGRALSKLVDTIAQRILDLLEA